MSHSVSALEYWVVREEERVERAVAAMDKASTTIEALRGVGKHEQARSTTMFTQDYLPLLFGGSMIGAVA
jgi:hypothetical protein